MRNSGASCDVICHMYTALPSMPEHHPGYLITHVALRGLFADTKLRTPHSLFAAQRNQWRADDVQCIVSEPSLLTCKSAGLRGSNSMGLFSRRGVLWGCECVEG